MDHRIYAMLGLCTKAGKVVSGDETCERTIKTGKAKLVIVAENASANTKKKYTDLCTYRNITLRFFGTKELLGNAMGKTSRGVLVIFEENFSKNILELITLGKDLSGGEAFGES
jgi:ribosomal protein L7Ae-like RNA K-turn-binding protein